ncbi:efflux transporter outer membrane subunit [Vogesella mureinivorans]|uniref:efflux transporter outer membrane subunit n=1 Tax=Vogesella mureinivorans TaxID=657276 RepID=UPI0011C77824|nr:efflux transporter outer membrane subunit [Vogesella mureinivorans]
MTQTPTAPLARTRLALLLGAGSLLAGCASVPDLPASPDLLPANQLQSSQSLPASQGEWAGEHWWQRYQDAQLNQLMQEALAQSPSLASARARLLQADGLAQQAGALQQPSVSANADFTRLRQSMNNGMPAAFVPPGFNTSSRVALDVSYELDFWGKNRSAIAAASSEQAAAQAELAQSQLLLTSAVASQYAELARLFADRDACQQALKVRSQSEGLIRERESQGLENRASVAQAASRRAAAAADLLAADEAITLQRQALAALLGAGPDRGLALQRPALSVNQAQALPAQLQANLIGHRPDLAAARLRAEAAASRIRVARAGFYPNVNLSAYVGSQSLGLDALTRAGSGIAGFGPAISLPLFRQDALQGSYRSARGEYDSAVASYNQTLLQALQDIAQAYTRQQGLAAQLAERSQALDAAQRAWELTHDRYQGGLASYLDVLNAEDSVIATRRTLAQLQSQQAQLDIALTKALGGSSRPA